VNIDRLRPTEADKDQLDLWLSGVINDALRDAVEAGLPRRQAGRIAVLLGESYMDHRVPVLADGDVVMKLRELGTHCQNGDVVMKLRELGTHCQIGRDGQVIQFVEASFVPAPKCSACGEEMEPASSTEWSCVAEECSEVGKAVHTGVYPLRPASPARGEDKP
jgi:hypothetical protein